MRTLIVVLLLVASCETDRSRISRLDKPCFSFVMDASGNYWCHCYSGKKVYVAPDQVMHKGLENPYYKACEGRRRMGR